MTPSPPRTPLATALAGARTRLDAGYEVAGDYGDPAGEYAAIRGGAGVVDRSTRGLVAVTGAEALSFLQSLLSQDVAALRDGEGAHTLLLQPQGKLEADIRLLVVGDECWLDCDAGVGERLAAALNRFRIRVAADVADRSPEYGCVTVAGPDALSVVAKATGIDPPHEHLAHHPWGGLRLLRADLPGGEAPLPAIDVIGPVDELEAAWMAAQEAGAVPAGFDAFEAVRIEAGVPRQGLDVDERTIPQEAFLERDAVSFTKGCFLGQELVCRIDTRGHVNKYLRGVVIAGAIEPPPGAQIHAGDAVAGALTSVAVSPDLRAPVALAMVRREIEPGTTVTIAWDGGEVAGEVRALPLHS